MVDKVICWDLDDTMGIFTAIEFSHGEFYVREGLADLLKRCKEEFGTVNVVTTNATLPYAKIALERGGLEEYFDNIYDRDYVMAWEGKKYNDVHSAYPEAELVIIGNSVRDKPVDLNGIFILDNTTPQKNTSTLEYLLEQIYSGTSCAESIEELYKNAEKTEGLSYRRIYSPTGDECSVMYANYKGLNNQQLKIPVIAIIKEEKKG